MYRRPIQYYNINATLYYKYATIHVYSRFSCRDEFDDVDGGGDERH